MNDGLSALLTFPKSLTGAAEKLLATVFFISPAIGDFMAILIIVEIGCLIDLCLRRGIVNCESVVFADAAQTATKRVHVN